MARYLDCRWSNLEVNGVRHADGLESISDVFMRRAAVVGRVDFLHGNASGLVDNVRARDQPRGAWLAIEEDYRRC
jgi:hypothetical protein